MNHDPDDALDAAYRHASDADAGRPSAATRAAILAEAARVAAAARRAEPAANEPRYVWRAVAGVAVLGVAVLLWRQVDHRLPGEAPQVVMPAVQEMQTASEAVPAPEDAAEADMARDDEARAAPLAPAAPVPPPPAPALAAQELAQATAALAVDAAPPSATVESASREEGTAAAPRLAQRAERSLSRLQAAPTRTLDLLQRHFPQHRERALPATYWLVLQADGTPLQSGELTGDATLESITAALAARPGADALQPWRLETVTNSRGVAITLALAEVSPR